MRTYPKVVQQIHSEFMSAGDVLLKQANEVLQKASESVIQKGERLAKLGFVQTREAVNASKILKQKEISEATAKLVIHYQMRYPNNKFITEDQVEAICKKYNLICGPVGRYKGFVPEEKVRQMESFKILEEDSNDGYVIFDPKEYTYDLDKLLAAFPDCKVPLKNFRVGDGWVRVYKNDNNKYGELVGKIYTYKEVSHEGMFICAPKKDMDTKELSKIGALLAVVTQRSIPDPVVLKPVNGGYFGCCCMGRRG